MEKWYKYESQCWYRNTFLVNRPSEISFATTQDNTGWNNIYDAGCHFVCLAMIIGINPAYLASTLGENKNHFKEDDGIDSLFLNGTEGLLIWDQNKPDKKNQELILKSMQHPEYGFTDINIKLIDKKYTNDEKLASDIIRSARSKSRHVICGYDDHSRLVAGINSNKFFLWDPDTSTFPKNKGLKKHLNGDYDLEKFYLEYERSIEKEEVAEYLIYSVKYSHLD